MYTKTQWVDNTTPIDKDNLNKIEQGIYDNSLVVDAVTNKLNPTDTETYKTAELTEGQITDVIGVSDIVIKGQTSQDGEPTPSSPVDVNVVSGSNVINTSNKNILDLSKYSTQTVNGVKLEFENGAIICNGTATANVVVNLLESNLTLQQGAYALSGCPSGGGISSNYKLDIFKINTSAQLAYDIGNGTTFTLSEQTTFDRVRLVIFNGKTVSNLVFKPQLEQNSAPTTYEPHQGKELPLDLGNIELCKIGNYQDYFYKSGSKWYLHKEIGKTILNGTENWSVSSGTGFYRFILTNNNFKNDASLATKKILISNMFKAINFNARNTDYNETCYQTSNGATSGAGMGINTNIASTVNDFKTWLASNNVIVYYVLATPTDTEITGTLKEQLEAIYNAPLYEQTNITQTNNDLPMVLDITACKDNINGIKAFIRK